jgi:AraC-like DNA-binding protein
MNKPTLLLDAPLTPEVRVKTWHQVDEDVPRWPVNVHETVELAWVDGGGLAYEIDHRTMIVPVGSAILVPRGVAHRTEIGAGTRAGSIHFAAEMFVEVASELGIAVPERAFGMAPDASVAVLARSLAEEATTDDLGKQLAVDAIAEAITVRALRSSTRPDRGGCGGGAGTDAQRKAASELPPGKDNLARLACSDARIRRAVEHLESSLDAPLSVDALARTARMSRFHFSRVFKSELGLSPHQFLMRARVFRAAELLRRGEVDVTEAAFSVGFVDLGRFSRTFRRFVGCAPSELKRRRLVS